MGFRLNSLPTIWYTAVMSGIQAYLLYLAFVRYRLHKEIKWPNSSHPELSLTLYYALCIACVPLLVFFVLFGLFKTGNLAGDNVKLGYNYEKKRAEHYEHRKQSCLCRLFRSCWRHSPPIPETLHVIAALCQLVAQQIMIAQLYRHGFINSGDFLNTELDFVYQRSRQLATNLPMGDTRLQGFRITTEELAGSPLAPNLLPILMHARLFGIPLEFVNLLIALMAYSSAYAAVFWKLNKIFSLYFTLHLITHCIDVVFTYLSFSVLYRIQETNFNSLRPVGLGQYLAAISPLMIYHPLIVLGTFVLTLLFMHLTPVALYAYGYSKYYEAIQNHARVIQANAGAVNVGLLDDYDGRPPRVRPSGGLCCDGYGSHMCAILLLMVIVIVKAPALYAILLLHNHEDQPFFISCIAVDVVYLFFWLFMWFCLTMKREWEINLPKYVPPYKPNLSGTINPPPPTNLFDPYRRTEADDKNATVYRPGSYASIRRPLRPAGLVFAHGTESNDYTTFDKYTKPSTLRASPTKYNDTSSTYGSAVFSGKEPASSMQLSHQTATLNTTRPIISGTHEQKPVLWGLQHSRPVNIDPDHQEGMSPQLVQGKSSFQLQIQTLPGITPSSTLTSQNSNPSTFQEPKQLNLHESTTTLTNVGGSQFATSVV